MDRVQMDIVQMDRVQMDGQKEQELFNVFNSRDSLEEQRLVGEVNRKLGYHRARRDILSWAKSRRRFIRFGHWLITY